MANRILRFPSFRAKRPSAMTDEELIEKTQQGDQSAWSAFLERYSDLLYGKAWEYSQSAQDWLGAEDWEDEVSDLYLFMATALQRSLKSFQGSCKPRTWVMAIIKNRSHILTTYLQQKDPGRADVRLPQIMQDRSESDQTIFKHLVRGLDLRMIAIEMDIPESHVFEIESLLASESPRVYARIQANRRAKEPKLSLDESFDDDDDRPPVQVATPDPDPEQHLEVHELIQTMHEAISMAIEDIPLVESRILILLYNTGLAPAEIVERAASDDNLGLSDVNNANRVYYLKDRALETILDQVIALLKNNVPGTVSQSVQKRELLKLLEEILKEQGVPAHPT